MKTLKFLSLTLVLLAYNYTSNAQVTPANVFTSSELVWYGLDFTEARFIGKFEQGFDENQVSASEMIHRYIPAWNKLVLEEPRNFDLKSAFRKNNVYYDIKPVENLNSKINPDGIFTYNNHIIMKDKLAGMIKA